MAGVRVRRLSCALRAGLGFGHLGTGCSLSFHLAVPPHQFTSFIIVTNIPLCRDSLDDPSAPRLKFNKESNRKLLIGTKFPLQMRHPPKYYTTNMEIANSEIYFLRCSRSHETLLFGFCYYVWKTKIQNICLFKYASVSSTLSVHSSVMLLDFQ